MDDWKPINYEGVWYTDPRDELMARTMRAMRGNDTYVAVPVKLAIACGKLRECGSTTILSSDEDGPIEPLTIICRRIQNHDGEHYNGYVNWK